MLKLRIINHKWRIVESFIANVKRRLWCYCFKKATNEGAVKRVRASFERCLLHNTLKI